MSNSQLLIPHSSKCPPGFITANNSIILSNYQLYAVEKWIVDRPRCYQLLVVYTGDDHHKITLNPIEPEPNAPDPDALRQKVIDTLREDGAKPKQTPHGILMVTSLAHFRSDYTIVHIPNGDFASAKDQLYANINLLRMGCSGRTALTLEEPSDTTKDRFISAYMLPETTSHPPPLPTSAEHLPLPPLLTELSTSPTRPPVTSKPAQIGLGRPSLNVIPPSGVQPSSSASWRSGDRDKVSPPNNSTSSLSNTRVSFTKTKERVAFVATVLELVKLIQASLAIFGLFGVSSVSPNLAFDGLLCDQTVDGIRKWISSIGGPCVNLEPSERIADPMFVSAILSLIISVRNKLAHLGYDPPKDPFLSPHRFALSLTSFVESTTPHSISNANSQSSGFGIAHPYARTYNTPQLSIAHFSQINPPFPSLVPPAPPPINVLSAAAAVAAAAQLQPPHSAPPIAGGTDASTSSTAVATGALPTILTREMVESISAAYENKLKSEGSSKKVRRAIKHKLVPSSAAGNLNVGPDSDGATDDHHLHHHHHHHHHGRRPGPGERRGTLSGGEGAGSPILQRNAGATSGASSTSAPGQLFSGIGSIASGIAGAAASAAAAGAGVVTVSGTGTVGSGNLIEGLMEGFTDLKTLVAVVKAGESSAGSAGRKEKKRKKSLERRREKERERGQRDDLSNQYVVGAGVGVAGTSAAAGGIGYAYTHPHLFGGHKDKERDRDIVVGASVRALWGGRVMDIFWMREEVTEEQLASTTTANNGSASAALHSITSSPADRQNSARAQPHHSYSYSHGQVVQGNTGSHKSSQSKDTVGKGHPTSSKRLSLSSAIHSATVGGNVRGKKPPAHRRTTTALAIPLSVASDGDDPAQRGWGSWKRGSSRDRERDSKYDGRSTEEESEGGTLMGNPNFSASAAQLHADSTGGNQSANSSFGAAWGGKVRGKLGSWAGLSRKKHHSVDLHAPPLPSSATSSLSRRPETPSVQGDKTYFADTSGHLQPPTLSKLIIGGGPVKVHSPGIVARRASGAQSPTLPPLTCVGDDDDLLSSGQVSPLSDHRPNPFNMFSSSQGSNSATSKTNLNSRAYSLPYVAGASSTMVGSLSNNPRSSTVISQTPSSSTRAGIAPSVAGSSLSNLSGLEYERAMAKLLLVSGNGESHQTGIPTKRHMPYRRFTAGPRIASWADPVSARPGGTSEGEMMEGDDEDDEDEVGEEEMDDERSELGVRRPRKRKRRERDPDLLEEELGSDVSEMRPFSGTPGFVFGGPLRQQQRREKARFHSLLSVVDGEGLLAEEELDEGSESDDEMEGDLGGYTRRRLGFDPKRRRSFHDLETFKEVEVLAPERMKVDVEICGQLLIMWRREEHLKNVVRCVQLLANSLSKENTHLYSHYQSHLSSLSSMDAKSHILSEIEEETARAHEITQAASTLDYEFEQLRVDDLWNTAAPSRRKVFELREKVFGMGGRRLPKGTHGAHGTFNRIQWTLDGKKRLVDQLGRTESEAEEENEVELSSSAMRGMEAEETEDEEDVVEHPGIKPMWLLRFFTSWGAKWSAAAAHSAPTSTTAPSTALVTGTEKETATTSETTQVLEKASIQPDTEERPPMVEHSSSASIATIVPEKS